MKQLENNTTLDCDENSKDDIFAVEEIEIEEMAIDGICGVY